MADELGSQIYELGTSTLSLTDVFPSQAASGATRAKKNTLQEFVDLIPVPTSSFVTTKVSVSSAEILALFTTAKTLVAAPGAGKIIFPVSFLIHLNFGTTAYSSATLLFKVGANFAPLGSAPNVLDGASSGYFRGLLSTAAGFVGADTVTNQPLQIYVTGSNPTTGNSTIDVYVSYYVITV